MVAHLTWMGPPRAARPFGSDADGETTVGRLRRQGASRSRAGPAPGGARTAACFAARAATGSQWETRVGSGTKLMLIGIQPRSPARMSVSDLALSPATAIGGCGCW